MNRDLPRFKTSSLRLGVARRILEHRGKLQGTRIRGAPRKLSSRKIRIRERSATAFAQYCALVRRLSSEQVKGQDPISGPAIARPGISESEVRYISRFVAGAVWALFVNGDSSRVGDPGFSTWMRKVCGAQSHLTLQSAARALGLVLVENDGRFISKATGLSIRHQKVRRSWKATSLRYSKAGTPLRDYDLAIEVFDLSLLATAFGENR